jgi:alpha-ketoglutarate-dependent taurine dioxygenase
MKTKKLNGFGSLGVEVYDINLQSCSDSELVELGLISADQLLVYINKENCSITPDRLNYIAHVFGDPFGGVDQSAYKMTSNRRKTKSITKKDLQTLKELRKIRSGVEQYDGMIRVTGKKDEEGDYLGMFAHGLLDWHCDRQGTGNFVPMIMLMSVEGSYGSSTEFLQTFDAYNALSKDWKDQLELLVGVHKYIPNKMAPGLDASQDNILRMNMCPIENSEVPVVCYSPLGRKGIRLTYATLDHFKDYSKKQSDEIIEYLKNWFMKPEFMYKQKWTDGELIMMDQTITLHRRMTEDCSKRDMIRQTCNFDKILHRGTQGLQNIGYASPGILVDGHMLTTEEYVEKFRYAY